MAHAADEVAVRRRDALLALRENAHVTAEAGSAGRRRDDATRFRELGEKPFLVRLDPDALRGGDDDAADAVGNLLALHHLRGDPEVADAAVRAAADHDLVDLDRLDFVDRVRVLGEMRERDRRLQLGEVDLDLARVFGVGVGLVHLRRLRAVFLQVVQTELIDREDAVLRARLNRHVRNREAVVHRKVLDAAADELERLIARAIDADEANQVKDQVLARNPLLRLARNDDLDRARHLEPRFARAHAGGHVRRADARRERADRTVRASVAVRADNAVARRDEPLLREKRMLDAAVVANFEVVLDLLLFRELTHARALGRGLDVLVRREMVGHERNLRLVEDLLPPELRELADRNRRRDVIAQNEVELRHDELARVDFLHPGVSRQDFLGHRHCHNSSILYQKRCTMRGVIG